jgi:hypothetical protein
VGNKNLFLTSKTLLASIVGLVMLSSEHLPVPNYEKLGSY